MQTHTAKCSVERPRPLVFLGSSKEALPIAGAVRAALSEHFQVDLWSESLFELGEDNLCNLLRFAQCYDFAVLLITADDVTTSRKETKCSPRDNVVFELGLFMGALGRRRTFYVVTQSSAGAPKMLSDLLGNNAVYLSKNLHKHPKPSLMTKELRQLVSALQERSLESNLRLLPSTGLAIGYFQNFLLPVCQELSDRTVISVDGTNYDLNKDGFDFTVVLPKNLSDASIQGAKKYSRQHSLKHFALQTPGRSYPFYVCPTLQEGRLAFYDYPTTLRASQEAVRIALSGPFIGNGKHHALLNEKEITNFHRTLLILLEEANAAEFRHRIHVVRCD